MGAQCPLPQRVPVPHRDDVHQGLFELGVRIDKTRAANAGGCMVAPYTLPDGWTMNDASWRDDLPIWHICDTERRIWATVSGAWKGTYDNDLKIYLAKGTETYDPPAEKVPPQVSEKPDYAALERALAPIAAEPIDAAITIMQNDDSLDRRPTEDALRMAARYKVGPLSPHRWNTS